jgi:type I protein arginine methyltransferase
MNKLQTDTILKRMPGVKIKLDSITEVLVSIYGKSDYYEEHTLAILDVFARPTSLKDALKKLQAKGAQDWIVLTATITKLYNAGVLAEQSQTQFTPDTESNSFGAPLIHIYMLNDRERTESFIQTIKETVKENDVVVDLGTGTGVLAVAAARAAASHVYAIEAGEMADVAQAVFNANNVAEKITLIRGWSTQIELPEKADVIVSEIIGNDAFAERVLQTMKDARQRLLKPGARFIPSKVIVYGLPLTIPSKITLDRAIIKEPLETWRNWYDVDFSPLRKMIDYSYEPLMHINSHKAVAWKILSEPIKLAEIDFSSFDETIIEQQITTKATQSGLLNGLLIFFELELGSKILTTHPRHAAESNHWLNPVWLFENARVVRMGDEFTIRYNYNVGGEQNEVRLLTPE